MISFQFKTYIADGAEYYDYGADYGKDVVQASKTMSFSEGLLSLIDMNIDEIEPTIRQLNEVLWQLTTTQEKRYVEEAKALLDELAPRHIYFQQFELDWKYRMSRALIFEQYTEDMLPRKYLYALPDTLRRMQGQIVELFENVLDTDNSDERGRTCREVGAINIWTRSKQDDEVFKGYRREYKKRFARMKAGKLPPEAFYTWSENAREQKDECESGRLARDAFFKWLERTVNEHGAGRCRRRGPHSRQGGGQAIGLYQVRGGAEGRQPGILPRRRTDPRRPREL